VFDYGIRFVWKSGLLGAKSWFDGWFHTCHGFTLRLTNYRKVHCKEKDLSVWTAAWAGPAGCSRARDAGRRRPWAPATGCSGCPPATLILFSCQRSEARQTARWRRAAGARVQRNLRWESCGRVQPPAAHLGEARSPGTIIQEGKKRLRSLMIVFMEIEPVTCFPERHRRGEAGEFPGITAGMK
jgi:hypothetical protein